MTDDHSCSYSPGTVTPASRSRAKIDAVLLSHGHGDHLGDALAIAKRDRPTVVTTFELATFCETGGAAVHKMHIGGAHEFPWGRVKLVPAFHGGGLDSDDAG